jgi:hypothetical protein
MDAFYSFLVKKFTDALLKVDDVLQAKKIACDLHLKESIEDDEADKLCNMLAGWTPSVGQITPTGGMAWGNHEFHDLAAAVCGKKPAAWLMSWKWNQRGQHRLLDAMLRMAERKGATVIDADKGIIVAKSPDIAQKLRANLEIIFNSQADKEEVSCRLAHKNVGLLLGYPADEVDKMFPDLACNV